MPRVCTICAHPQRAAIEAQLVAGEANRRIATQHGLTEAAVRRHKDGGHISERIAQAQEAREEAQALDVVKQLQAINGIALNILQEARAVRNHDTALKAIDRIHKQIELQAKLLGDLQDGGAQATVNVVLAPEWLTLRTIVLGALAVYPEARQAVVQALTAAERGG